MYNYRVSAVDGAKFYNEPPLTDAQGASLVLYLLQGMHEESVDGAIRRLCDLVPGWTDDDKSQISAALIKALKNNAASFTTESHTCVICGSKKPPHTLACERCTKAATAPRNEAFDILVERLK